MISSKKKALPFFLICGRIQLPKPFPKQFFCLLRRQMLCFSNDFRPEIISHGAKHCRIPAIGRPASGNLLPGTADRHVQPHLKLHKSALKPGFFFLFSKSRLYPQQMQRLPDRFPAKHHKSAWRCRRSLRLCKRCPVPSADGQPEKPASIPG